jgi:hypothetical protein
MSLETFTGKVSDLVETNPTGSDPRSQGDDHIRGVKKTIIGQSVNCQIGQNAIAANNFTITSVANDGTMKLARGNAGATTQDIMTVSANGGVRLLGGTTAPTTGQVGETISVEFTGPSGNITNNIAGDITSLAIPPGVWDVSGSISFFTQTGPSLVRSASLSLVSATISSIDTMGQHSCQTSPGYQDIVQTPLSRYVFTSTTTVYLVYYAIFSGGTMQLGKSILSARRVA